MSVVYRDVRPRCRECGKLLAESVTRPWTIRCGRCKTENRESDPGARHVVGEMDGPDQREAPPWT